MRNNTLMVKEQDAEVEAIAFRDYGNEWLMSESLYMLINKRILWSMHSHSNYKLPYTC